ncbi:MAG: DUF4332 domain-containing protein [Gammaproteobacteria bacterium]|nr:DUF4332 domain-containing protein [Gammaproteobacteria bacterium]
MNIQDLIANYQLSEHLHLWLAVAFLVGLLIGLIWGRTIGRASANRVAKKSTRATSADPASAAGTTSVAATNKGRAVSAEAQLTNLVGMNDNHVNKLVGIGIESIDDLLAVARDQQQCEALADELQLEDFVINKWVRMAEFLRIPELSPQVAEFLVFAGVNSVDDLAQRNPESLAHKLEHVNSKEKRIADVPSRRQIENWLTHLQSR